ncbi:MAG: aldo/keto reductase [Blautia sp.]
MSVDVTKMPKLGFGMMRLPEKDGELDLEQICKMVDAYLASGMNYFDTAYMYCGGKSESIVKKALVERHPRESFTLTTKLPQWMMDEGIEGVTAFSTISSRAPEQATLIITCCTVSRTAQTMKAM